MNDFCLDCGDWFRYDDCGGYNPPCSCHGYYCRSCCEAQVRESDEDDGFCPEPEVTTQLSERGPSSEGQK